MSIFSAIKTILDMIKRLFLLALVIQLTACDPAALQQAMGSVLGSGELTTAEISSGLKQALEIGITEGAQKLSQTDGYFKSPYKIFLPPEARKVTDKLQNVPGWLPRNKLPSPLVFCANMALPPAVIALTPLPSKLVPCTPSPTPACEPQTP